jgi:hypothetical protein
MIVVADKSITSDNIFSFVKVRIPVSPTAPPKRMALSFVIGVIVWPKRA